MSRWVCKACDLTGEIVPVMDIEGPPYRVSDDIAGILRDHARRVPKGDWHGALIEVQR